MVSVATAADYPADYPDDKVTLSPATTDRRVRTQATQGSPGVCGAWGQAVVGCQVTGGLALEATNHVGAWRGAWEVRPWAGATADA